MKESDFRRTPCLVLPLPPEVSEAINAAYSPGEDVILGYAARKRHPDHEERVLVCWSVDRKKLIEVMKESGIVYKRMPKRKK